MGTTDGLGYFSVSTRLRSDLIMAGYANFIIVEGIITVLFGSCCFFFMPSTPAQAKFLTDEERAHALRRMRLDATGATTIDVDEEHLNWYWIKMALLSPQTYFCAIIWFFLLVPLYVSELRCSSLLFNLIIMNAELLVVPSVHHQRDGL